MSKNSRTRRSLATNRTRSRLLCVGLTGGLAAGKSQTLALFNELGCATASADAFVHDILASGELDSELTARFGEDIVEGGLLAREKIAEIVFNNPDQLAWLESVIFPHVGEELKSWLDGVATKTSSKVAVVEIPLLFEADMDDMFDFTVCVVAGEAVREARMVDRDHRGGSGRQARQLSQEEKAARANFVIDNSGSIAELRSQVSSVLESVQNG